MTASIDQHNVILVGLFKTSQDSVGIFHIGVAVCRGLTGGVGGKIDIAGRSATRRRHLRNRMLSAVVNELSLCWTEVVEAGKLELHSLEAQIASWNWAAEQPTRLGSKVKGEHCAADWVGTRYGSI